MKLTTPPTSTEVKKAWFHTSTLSYDLMAQCLISFAQRHLYVLPFIIVVFTVDQEPFDPEEFVERLAWRTVADSRGEGTGNFDPVLLHETFLQAIK
jgi:hypothetical protein